MKIKEVCDQTGLSRKTIRFYEARGLISPRKTTVNGKDFRDYVPADVQTLKEIATLRRARFTVEEIRRMQDNPAETKQIFSAYKSRLVSEERELLAILTVAAAIPEDRVTDVEALAREMSGITEDLPLPAQDVHPHFRYLDELEETLTRKNRKSNLTKAEQAQRKLAAQNAVMYAGFSVQNSPGNNMAAGGKGGGTDIGNAQKIAAYNLLMNSKDD